MSIIVDLKEELNTAQTLDYVSNTLTEVNSLKAKKIRAGFEKNRQFYDEITYVYHIIKINARRLKILKLHEGESKKNSGSSLSFLTLKVAVTANSYFYGSLNYNVLKKILSEAAGANETLAVIGQTGIEYLQTTKPQVKFLPIRFGKDRPSPAEVGDFIDFSQSYDRILIYFPRFQSMISQKPDVVDLSQEAEVSELGQESKLAGPKLKSLAERWDQAFGGRVEKIDYIFEPELLKTLSLLEKQIKTLLFNRILLEVELSRTAARLISMNLASQKARDLVSETRQKLIKAVWSERNARLLETFSGIRQWSTI